MSITSVIGPLLMNSIFAWFVRPNGPVYFPGAAMMLRAVLTVASCLLAHRTFRKREGVTGAE
jgi:DHA1 family tetracycline resistance protein-like MFS transporter